MAQSYFPTRVASPLKQSTFANAGDLDMHAERHFRVEDVQEAYIESKDRLVNAIDSTKSILNGIRTFNKDEWVVRYPQLKESTREPEATDKPSRKSMRRSLSFADDPSFETEVVVEERRASPKRSLSLPMVVEEPGCDVEPSSKDAEGVRLIPGFEFNVLRLDLKLGSHQSSSSAAALVSQLEKASIANLLDERITSAVAHMEKLRLRVEDTSSKVLVTGDLNAGKSTFVNALLRREVMPVDQQPCTTAFCEVHDAAENNNKEEVHVVKEGVTYDINDDSTYTSVPISELEAVVSDNEENQPMIKLYLGDSRAPSESLLNNGVVDISLIDAPGLNRDSLKTTALFARQEEIDVVVFVVSSENHFTLSAKEFLTTASKEKAYVFIVVNKFDQIKNKEKCRRLVLEQIKQLSPRTYDDAEDLVHFVDSAAALQPSANPAFDDLESSLRSFVLVKRSKSKLHPVATYLANLLSDVELLASANNVVAEADIQRARDDLSEKRPVLEKMKKSRDLLENSLESVEEEGASKTSSNTKSVLNAAIERVGNGKLAVDSSAIPLPSYPGLLGLWDYARDVRRALLSSIDAAVKQVENDARMITTDGVNKINALGEEHLPAGVERAHRVFMPEAMFSVTRRSGRGHKSRRSSSAYSHIGGAIVAGGIHGLGIGLAQRHDLLETTFFDLFDVNHQFLVHFTDGKEESEGMTPTALSVVSVGLGALTMVGGQAIGARAVVEGVVRISDMLSNEATRKWAAPIIGAVVLGATAYLILELPASIPRTVGRRIKASIVRGDGQEHDVQFVDGHAERISRETRKVLRLASWDLREKFRGAMDERAKEVSGAEKMEKEALKAKNYFESVTKEAGVVRDHAKLETIGV
ncbi:transmembrane GTPase fzo1 [Coprinopsis marcescibilis]|uniref:Transmembrane GTPase fzo1 n=1 Tax=Coprinopsis marcescibilis TaxID=230819 RepID=A0A5C3KWV9_COPMA|nr:transmembrane GTPase fzo1 [Coprinopsis marcescibilis]